MPHKHSAVNCLAGRASKFLAVGLATLLMGCGTFVVNYSPELPLHKIALLSIPEAGDYFLELPSAQVWVREGPNLRLANDLVSGSGFDLSRYLERSVIERFRASHIEVMVVPFRRLNPHALAEPSEINGVIDRNGGVDAVLDIAPSSPGYHFGYDLGEHQRAHPRPMIGMSVQLVSARTRKVLYRDRFAYGYQVPPGAEDEKYIFTDVAALESDHKLAVAGLKYATDSVASYLVSQLTP